MVNSKELRKQMLSKQTGKIPLKTHGWEPLILN
jgi:hypothetical protein